MRVKEIMTTGVQTVPPTRSADEAWTLMRQNRIHHLVVTRGARIAGVLSERDCGGRNGASVRRDRTVGDLMTSPAVSVTSNTTTQRAANMMRGQSIGCLVVADKGRVTGIVTASDLLELVGRGTGAREASAPRAALHHRVPHRKQRRPGVW